MCVCVIGYVCVMCGGYGDVCGVCVCGECVC